MGASGSSDDRFRSRLDQIINMRHELARLGGEIDWEWIDAELADLFSETGPGLSIRPETRRPWPDESAASDAAPPSRGDRSLQGDGPSRPQRPQGRLRRSIKRRPHCRWLELQAYPQGAQEISRWFIDAFISGFAPMTTLISNS
jgi:hypothetical protein